MKRSLTLLAAVLCAGGLHAQQKGDAKKDEPKPEMTLTKEQKAAAKDLIPSPAEFIHSVRAAKVAKWGDALKAVEARGDAKLDKASNPVKALNLGIEVADALVAVEAKDKAAFEKSADIVRKLAKELGASEKLTARGETVADAVKKGHWPILFLHIESFREDLLKEFGNIDPDAAMLATAGGWLEGLALMSGVIEDNYSEGASKVLRHGDFVARLRKSAEKLSERARGDAKVKELVEKLGEIEKLLSVDKEAPVSKETVKKVHEISSALVKSIQS